MKKPFFIRLILLLLFLRAVMCIPPSKDGKTVDSPAKLTTVSPGSITLVKATTTDINSITRKRRWKKTLRWMSGVIMTILLGLLTNLIWSRIDGTVNSVIDLLSSGIF